MGERRRRPEGVKLGRAAARGGTWERRRLRLHRLKRHAPVQFAVRPPQQLRRSTEMKVRVSRIADGPTAVISFESVYGLGLLGLGHFGPDNSCGEGCAPSAKSAPMCWRYLYIGAWLVAFNAAGMRPIGRGAQGSARCRSRAPLGTRGVALAPASLCLHARPHTYRPANECCCCKAADGGFHSAHTVATTADALETFGDVDSSKLQRRSSVRHRLALAIAVIAILGILALAVMFMISAWMRTNDDMSIEGRLVFTNSVLISLIVGCLFMALVFYSNRRGYDERAHAAQSHREVP